MGLYPAQPEAPEFYEKERPEPAKTFLEQARDEIHLLYWRGEHFPCTQVEVIRQLEDVGTDWCHELTFTIASCEDDEVPYCLNDEDIERLKAECEAYVKARAPQLEDEYWKE